MAVSTFLSYTAVKKSKCSTPLDFQDVHDQLLQVLPMVMTPVCHTALDLQRSVELVNSCAPDLF